MYNLFVSAGADAWTGEPWTIEEGRCVREYTDADTTARYGELDAAAVAELKARHHLSILHESTFDWWSRHANASLPGSNHLGRER